MAGRRNAFTLLEVVVVAAILGLMLGIVVPRLGDREALVLDATARRLADTLAYLRERAILGGVPMRMVLDLDAGRWAVGGAGRDATAVEAGASPLERPATLPDSVRVRAVHARGAVARAGTIALDLEPGGDGLPTRVELVDRRGRTVAVVLPPGGGRARVVAREAA
jgi:type II secretion system protein H